MNILAILVYIHGFLPFVHGSIPGGADHLTVTWNIAAATLDLKKWELSEVQKFKRSSSHERDPLSGKVARWEGVLLSQIVEKALEDLPNEKRAQVDLIVLKNKEGQSAFLPRALVTKYPVLLAFGKSVDTRGPFYSVMPWTSRAKILNESLPLERFFVPGIVRIELSNYRDRYSQLFLKRRTDPLVMRGEKLFVQNCVSCHMQGSAPGLIQILDDKKKVFATVGHPGGQISFKMLERDRQSILRYLDAYKVEKAESPGVFSRMREALRTSSSN